MKRILLITLLVFINISLYGFDGYARWKTVIYDKNTRVINEDDDWGVSQWVNRTNGYPLWDFPILENGEIYIPKYKGGSRMYERNMLISLGEPTDSNKPYVYRLCVMIEFENDKNHAIKLFRIEETKLIENNHDDQRKYSVDYYTLTEPEMHEKFGKLANGQELDNFDNRDGLKILLHESDDKFTYALIQFKEEQFVPKINKERDLFDESVQASEKAPFRYDLKYKNSKGIESVLYHVDQEKEFQIPIYQEMVFDSMQNKLVAVKGEIIGMILPEKYENDVLTLTLIVNNVTRVGWMPDKNDWTCSTFNLIKETLIFKKDDVIEYKLPKYWPGPLMRKGRLYAHNPDDKGYVEFYDPQIKEQSIIIKLAPRPPSPF